MWDVTVNGDVAKLTDSNGVTIAPKGGNNNGIKAADYEWKVEFTDGTFRFLGQGSDTVILASNTDSQYGNKFRGYKSTTVGNYPDSYPSYFTLYKLDSGSSTEPTDPAPSDPAPSEPVVGERATGLVTDPGVLQAGDSIVIFNPANGKALSTAYAGYYNAGTDVAFADGVLTGYTDADVWTLGINDDGSYTFATSEGKKLSMGAEFTSTPLDDVNPNWSITAASASVIGSTL